MTVPQGDLVPLPVQGQDGAFTPGCRWHLGSSSEEQLGLKLSPIPPFSFRHPADAAQEGATEQSQVQAEPSPVVAGLHAPQQPLTDSLPENRPL